MFTINQIYRAAKNPNAGLAETFGDNLNVNKGTAGSMYGGANGYDSSFQAQDPQLAAQKRAEALYNENRASFNSANEPQD